MTTDYGMKQLNDNNEEIYPQSPMIPSSESSTAHNLMREALPGEEDLLTELRESSEPRNMGSGECFEDLSVTYGDRSQPPPYSASSLETSRLNYRKKMYLLTSSHAAIARCTH